MVVEHTRHGELAAARSTADLLGGFQHVDIDPGAERVVRPRASPLGPDPTTTAAADHQQFRSDRWLLGGDAGDGGCGRDWGWARQDPPPSGPAQANCVMRSPVSATVATTSR